MKAEANDIRNQSAYGLTETARYVRLPAATLRSWVIGRDYPKGDSQATFHPLIKPAHKQPVQLSFYNLIEAHVLRSLRTEHGVALAELRNPLPMLRRSFKCSAFSFVPICGRTQGRCFLIGMSS